MVEAPDADLSGVLDKERVEIYRVKNICVRGLRYSCSTTMRYQDWCQGRPHHTLSCIWCETTLEYLYSHHRPLSFQRSLWLYRTLRRGISPPGVLDFWGCHWRVVGTIGKWALLGGNVYPCCFEDFWVKRSVSISVSLSVYVNRQALSKRTRQVCSMLSPEAVSAMLSGVFLVVVSVTVWGDWNLVSFSVYDWLKSSALFRKSWTRQDADKLKLLTWCSNGM